MKLQSTLSRISLGVGMVLFLATLAEAQATRTWVSGVGDDANPCSRTAPCKTFAGAISKTAAGGYIDVIDPGGFGAVTITKSITIDGGPFMSGVLSTFGSNGININGAGISVKLRNLDLEGASSGNHAINVISAAAVHVENVHIVDWAGNGINFAPGAQALLFVSNSEIRKTGGVVVTNGRAIFDHYKAEANTAAAVRANANAHVTVRNSYLASNSEGVTTAAASAVANIENCIMTGNVFGILGTGGATIRVSNSQILSNTNFGMQNDGTVQIISLGGNSVEGNINNGVFTQTLAKQ
jgi:hypothetical protein